MRQTHGIRKQSSIFQGLGSREWGETANEYGVSFRVDKKFRNLIVVVVAKHWGYI